MDRGIWATWYDLANEGRQDYLAWLHECCLPRVLEHPGYLWAAHIERTSHKDFMKKAVLRHSNDPTLPAGKDYLLLLGGVDAHVFVNPPVRELQTGPDRDAAAMLGRRLAERTCIFAEVARVDGPAGALRGPGMTPGPGCRWARTTSTRRTGRSNSAPGTPVTCCRWASGCRVASVCASLSAYPAGPGTVSCTSSPISSRRAASSNSTSPGPEGSS